MAINQSISQFPPAPDADGDTPEEFSNKADAFVNHQEAVYVDEVNQWAVEANLTASEVNANAGAAEDAKDEARSARDEAVTASQSAVIAASEADDSATRAAVSETNAGISETEAVSSASAAASSAEIASAAVDYMGEWDVATAYVVGQSVTRNDSFYICKQDNTGEDPETATDFWAFTMDNALYYRLDGSRVLTGAFRTGMQDIEQVNNIEVFGDLVVKGETPKMEATTDHNAVWRVGYDSLGKFIVSEQPNGSAEHILLEVQERSNSVLSMSSGSIMYDGEELARETLFRGEIKLWYGKSIPPRWYLCDGSKGTPDLKDEYLETLGGEIIPYIIYLGV